MASVYTASWKDKIIQTIKANINQNLFGVKSKNLFHIVHIEDSNFWKDFCWVDD